LLFFFAALPTSELPEGVGVVKKAASSSGARSARSQSGVALRLPPQSRKKIGTGLS